MEVEQNESKKRKSGKKVLIGFLAAMIILLILALVIFATPLNELSLAKKTAPEVTLELLKDPELDAESGKYLFEVEAKATGNPTPEVTFNRYDDPEEVGENRITLLLESGESFTLVVVAESSAGKATAQLELVVEGTDDSGVTTSEPEPPPATENRPPVISDIVFAHELLRTGKPYTVTAQVSDPDGDTLTYQWSVTGGTVPNLNVNPISWTTPNIPGDPQLSVVVRDGKGGEAVLSKQVPVGYLQLSPIPSQSGQIIKDQEVKSPACAYAGDSNTNRIVRGFISFDIGDLDGIPIKTAELRLAEPRVWGDPAFLHGTIGLWVGVVRWGDRPLVLADYNLSGVGIRSFTTYDITLASVAGQPTKLFVDELQKNINDGMNRLQVRLHFASEVSDSDSQWDGVEYQLNTISLYLTF